MLFIFLVFMLCFMALTVRLGWHMIIKGDEYASKATGQQTSDTTILATRGSIVDRNGADLAISATTHTSRPRCSHCNRSWLCWRVLPVCSYTCCR